MKVETNISIFTGETSRSQQIREQAETKQEKQANANTIFAGDLGFNQDSILFRKQMAQKKALKVVGDAWANEQKIEEDFKSRREHMKQLNQEYAEAQKQVKEITDQKEHLKEVYFVKEDSQEQQDLELLRKRRDLLESNQDLEENLTEEELDCLGKIDEKGMTEYQKRSLELDSVEKDFRLKVKQKENELYAEDATLRSMRLERLKYAPMLKAQQQADEIEKAASEEAVNMLIDEAKDHIDEEQEERKEEAEEIKEEKEEQEEVIEQRREDRAESEKRAEELAESIPMQEMLQLGQVKTEVQKEIQNIVDKMKLVEEDIKGSLIDESL